MIGSRSDTWNFLANPAYKPRTKKGGNLEGYELSTDKSLLCVAATRESICGVKTGSWLV